MSKEKSLRNEIDIEIPYVDDKGQKGIKKVHIAIITQGIRKEYVGLITELMEIVKLNNDLDTITQKMGDSIANRVEVVKGADGDLHTVKKSFSEVRSDIRDLQKEYDTIIARVNGIGSQIDNKKYNLAKHILCKNGIEDTDLLSSEWWDDCTDEGELMLFIHSACNKDNDNIESKKKVPVIPKSSI